MSKQLSKIIADSLNTATGDRITTFILPRFPKIKLQELNTHRVASKNAASSRAIPVKKMISRLEEDPFVPQFTKAKRGMQGIEDDDPSFQSMAESIWMETMGYVITQAERLLDMGVHKQDANMLLEPFARVPDILTATTWDNMFKLRCADDAHPAFREVARSMREAYEASTPKELNPGEWHIPMFTEEMKAFKLVDQLIVATARGARVSLANHDGSQFSLEKDTGLHDGLISNKHMSPFEHPAKALFHLTQEDTRNFTGWYSYRAHLEDGRAVA